MAHRNNCINTGITAISKVNRGTHLCHFFKGREDLTDVIIPFIRAGLVDNEKCILLTSDLLERNKVYRELNITVTDTNDYTNSGQLVVTDHNDWYTEGGKIDINNTLGRWIEAEKQALNEGFLGLRAVDVMPGEVSKDWDDIAHYEMFVDSLISKLEMVILCSYSLDNLGIDQVIEAAANHGVVIIRHNNDLIAIGNSRPAKVGIMKEAGLTYTTIAGGLGITKQRAHQILNKRRIQKKEPPESLTTSIVASLLNLHINTVRPWSNKGILPAWRIGSRHDRRFNREDINKLVKLRE